MPHIAHCVFYIYIKHIAEAGVIKTSAIRHVKIAALVDAARIDSCAFGRSIYATDFGFERLRSKHTVVAGKNFFAISKKNIIIVGGVHIPSLTCNAHIAPVMTDKAVYLSVRK